MTSNTTRTDELMSIIEEYGSLCYEAGTHRFHDGHTQCARALLAIRLAVELLHADTRPAPPVHDQEAFWVRIKNLASDAQASEVMTSAAAMLDEQSANAIDAARYRWLRQQHWSDAPMCVVIQPHFAVKLGHDCPAGDRLDDAIDAAMSATAPPAR